MGTLPDAGALWPGASLDDVNSNDTAELHSGMFAGPIATTIQRGVACMAWYCSSVPSGVQPMARSCSHVQSAFWRLIYVRFGNVCGLMLCMLAG